MGKNSNESIAKKQNGAKVEKQNEYRQDVRRLMMKLRRKSSGSSGEGYFIGIDLGDKKSNYCFMDRGEDFLAEDQLPTTQEAFGAYFTAISKSRIALEVGTHSPWVSCLLQSLGHEVYVANPRKMESIQKNKRKNDKKDARTLTRLVRADPELLYPIRHRGIEARESLILLRARDGMVRARTKLINCVRGLVKSVGGRVPKCTAESFHNQAEGAVPGSIRPMLLPIVEQIASLTVQIQKMDRQVEAMAEKQYPETTLLRQVKGVGAVTSLAYLLTLEKPERFEKSRDVGPYLGLVPKQDDSGESTKQLRITKTGDGMVRRLLVGSAHYILGPFGPDTDLRRFGMKLATRGGKNARKRAVTAVARKLAVLLHRLWVTAEEYEPLRNAGLQEEALAAVAQV
jgi:transposase